jgi:hypothetical protein
MPYFTVKCEALRSVKEGNTLRLTATSYLYAALDQERPAQALLVLVVHVTTYMLLCACQSQTINTYNVNVLQKIRWLLVCSSAERKP